MEGFGMLLLLVVVLLLLLCPCPLLWNIKNALRAFIFHKYRVHTICTFFSDSKSYYVTKSELLSFDVLPFIDAHSFMHNLLCSVWLSLLFEIDNNSSSSSSSRASTWSLWWFYCSISNERMNDNGRTKRKTTTKNNKKNSRRFFARVCLALSGYLTFYGCYKCWMKSRFFFFLFLLYFFSCSSLFVCYCNCCRHCYAFVWTKSREKMSRNFNECFFACFLIDLDRFRGIGMREQSFKSH